MSLAVGQDPLGAETFSDHASAPAQPCHIRAALEPDYNPPACPPVLFGTFRLPNTFEVAKGRLECPFQDLHTKETSPILRWRHNLVVATPSLPVGFGYGSRGAGISGVLCELLTPTSLYRTSLHSAPKSFIRAKASSRRFPFSTPDETRGMGISRWTR